MAMRRPLSAMMCWSAIASGVAVLVDLAADVGVIGLLSMTIGGTVLSPSRSDLGESEHSLLNRTDRLYAIAEELRSAGAAGRTSGWLARRFEVAVRTVKRDVSALQESGLPIWARAGPGGGYVLDSAATLPPLNLTAAEATAVALALVALPRLPFAPDGRSALTKILSAMPAQERAGAVALGERLWIRDARPAARPAVANVLDEALQRGVVTVLDYVDKKGTSTRRRAVEPMALASTGGHWFLLAWCRRRRAGRWFRLDRIESAHVTTELAPTRDLLETFGEPPIDARPISLTD